jgi:hypothetical protein
MFYGVVEAVHVYGTGGYVRSRQPHIVEFESPLWWKRKPKRITDEEAAEALKEAAKVIKATAQAQVAESIPEAQRKGQARKAIEPVALQMPGFDWRPMYEQAYSEALTQAILAQLTLAEQRKQALARQRVEDDEIALLMLL